MYASHHQFIQIYFNIFNKKTFSVFFIVNKKMNRNDTNNCIIIKHSTILYKRNRPLSLMSLVLVCAPWSLKSHFISVSMLVCAPRSLKSHVISVSMLVCTPWSLKSHVISVSVLVCAPLQVSCHKC